MAGPLQGTPVEREVRALSNTLLSGRVWAIAQNRRAMPKESADAVLFEAARRLQWDDAYESHREPRRSGRWRPEEE